MSHPRKLDVGHEILFGRESLASGGKKRERKTGHCGYAFLARITLRRVWWIRVE
jgi:hypothetical protein